MWTVSHALVVLLASLVARQPFAFSPADRLAAGASATTASAAVASATTANATTANATTASARTASAATVSGVVRDSLSGGRLAGAQVQLISADTLTRFGQTVMSDSLGAFTFLDVPTGRFLLGFFHPKLDSLGIDAAPRVVTVTGDRSVRTDLALPSLSGVRALVCGAANAPGTGGVLTGVVRDAAKREPIAGVVVRVEWMELSIGKGGVQRHTARHVVITNASGRYTLCDVPNPGTLALIASKGADSTDFVGASVSTDGVLRRELYLGAARTVARAVSRGDSASRLSAGAALNADSVAAPLASVHVGDGTLRGQVMSADGTRPLAGVQVGMPNGPQTRTNARGEWTLPDAPMGTRTIEMRAVGFYPERQTVDVIDDVPPIVSTLATFKSVLDTMKVSAKFDRYSKLSGFRERSRSGMGTYLTATDVARREPLYTSDLFLRMPGVYLESGTGSDTQSTFGGGGPPATSANLMPSDRSLVMRGTFTHRCLPNIYLNDALLPNVTASDIDAFIRPQDILGVEVYTSTAAPAQFQQGLSGCGSIVFWTK